MLLIGSMALLGGCSQKIDKVVTRPYSGFVVYPRPEKIKVSLKADKCKESIIALASKTRKQDKILDAYENDIKRYYDYIKVVKPDITHERESILWHSYWKKK